MLSNTIILEYLRRCSDPDDLDSCEKCPYLKWSKRMYGENKCKNMLMQDAYHIVYEVDEEKQKVKKLSKLDSVDVVDFFAKIVKVKKDILKEYGVSDSNIANWAKKISTPKMPKFVSVLRALGYDIKVVRRNNDGTTDNSIQI